MRLRALVLWIAVLLLSAQTVFAQDSPLDLSHLETITAENADQLTQLAQYGDGIPTGSVAWSPDGEWLAVAGTLGTWLYDPDDLTAPVRTLDLVGGAPTFSPDSRLLAIVNADGVHLWDVRGSREVALLDSGAPIAFSPDGETIATSGRTDVHLWEIATGRRLATHALENVTSIEHIAFSPDGSLLLATWERVEIYCLHGGEFSGVHVWDLDSASGSDALEYFGLEAADYLSSFAIHPDGRIAFHSSQGVILVEPDSGAETLLLERQNSVFAYGLAFSPDGETLAVSIVRPGSPDTIQLLAVPSGEVVATIDDFSTELAFSPDNPLLAVNARVWNLETLRREPVLLHDRFTLAPNGETILHYTTDNTIRLHAATGEPLAPLPVPANVVREVRYTPDNTAMILRARGTIYLIDMATGRQRGSLPIDIDRPLNVAFSPANHFASIIAWNNRVTLWNLDTGDEVVVPLEPGERIVPPYFTPDDSLLISRRQDEARVLRLRDPRTGEEATFARMGDVQVRRVYFTDARVMTIGENADTRWTLQIWDRASGDLLATFPDLAWDSLEISPDGAFLAYQTERRSIRMIRLETARPYAYIRVPSDALLVDFLRFSRDSTKLIIGTQGEGGECYSYDDHVWDIATRTEVDEDPEPAERLFTVTPNGEVRAPVAHLLQLTDAATGAELVTLEGHRGTVNRIVFHPNGRLLLTEGADGTVIVRGVPR